MIVQKLDYIHRNPVRAGIVAIPQYDKYGSASNYFEEGRGVFEVELLEEYFVADF